METKIGNTSHKVHDLIASKDVIGRWNWIFIEDPKSNKRRYQKMKLKEIFIDAIFTCVTSPGCTRP